MISGILDYFVAAGLPGTGIALDTQKTVYVLNKYMSDVKYLIGTRLNVHIPLYS